MTGKCLAGLAVVVIFLSKYITDDIRRVATALDVDQQWGVSHHHLLRDFATARICLSEKMLVVYSCELMKIF